jgi:hypothetical protein
MKAIGRLLATYFLGAGVLRWITVLGLLLILASVYVVLYVRATEHMLAFAMSGVLALFLGSSLMPLTLGRLAQSRAACILPGARLKLLASAVLTVLLVALPTGLLAPFAFIAGMSADVRTLGEHPALLASALYLALYTYTSCCLIAAWLYLAMWFISSERNVAGFAKAMMVLLILVFAPQRDSEDLRGSFVSNLAWMAAYAVTFSLGFLSWPRLKRWLAVRSRLRGAADGHGRDLAGKEVDLVLGNAQPWLLIVPILLPMAIFMRMDDMIPAVWLFFLTISSAVAGAISGQAPERSRALWLRGDWSRAALFAAVERSAWRHNGLVLLALMAFLLGAGSYAAMPTAIMAAGVPLLILGTVLSTYLGLMLTRGVRWVESVLGAGVMLALMTIALLVGEGKIGPWPVAVMVAVMAALAVGLRQVARHRWARIDWSRCRSESQPALRTG